MPEPAVTVLMGLYDCEGTLRESLDSLLAQTYEGFRVILCDDGSSDGTAAVAESYCVRDPERFLLIRNDANRGLAFTLNRCLGLVDTEFVARQDGDDVSEPERFRIQLRMLRERPGDAFVSAPMRYFDESGEWGRGTAVPHPTPRDFVAGTPFCHAPCMLRTSALRAVDGYRDEPWTRGVEDYDLWFRLYAAGFRGSNAELPLYRMRDDRSAARRRNWNRRWSEARVRHRGLRTLGFRGLAVVSAARPLLVGLLPPALYRILHRRRLQAR